MPQTTRPGCLGMGRGLIGPGVAIISAHLSKILRGVNGFIVQAPRRASEAPRLE